MLQEGEQASSREPVLPACCREVVVTVLGRLGCEIKKEADGLDATRPGVTDSVDQISDAVHAAKLLEGQRIMLDRVRRELGIDDST